MSRPNRLPSAALLLAATTAVLGLTRTAAAQDVPMDVSPAYHHLFSHAPEDRPLRTRLFMLETGVQLGAYTDGQPAYTAYALSRLLIVVGLGVAVTDQIGQTAQPRATLLFPLWLLEVNDWAVYAPLGLLDMKHFFAGGGLSIPIARHWSVRAEAAWIVDDDRIRVTAGLTYRLL